MKKCLVVCFQDISIHFPSQLTFQMLFKTRAQILLPLLSQTQITSIIWLLSYLPFAKAYLKKKLLLSLLSQVDSLNNSFNICCCVQHNWLLYYCISIIHWPRPKMHTMGRCKIKITSTTVCASPCLSLSTSLFPLSCLLYYFLAQFSLLYWLYFLLSCRCW